MAPEDIESPPYPNEGVNPDGLYNMLGKLKEWVDLYKDDLNKEVGQDIIPVVKALPNKKAYLIQPVLGMFSHLILIRRIREQWDNVVRNYEDSWDHKMCVRQRVVIVQSAAMMLNSAFTPFEHREARRQSELEELQQQFARVQMLINTIMEPDKYDPVQAQKRGG
jgi:hypothetical protein